MGRESYGKGFGDLLATSAWLGYHEPNSFSEPQGRDSFWKNTSTSSYRELFTALATHMKNWGTEGSHF